MSTNGFANVQDEGEFRLMTEWRRDEQTRATILRLVGEAQFDKRREVVACARFQEEGDSHLWSVVVKLARPHRPTEWVVWTYNAQARGFFGGFYSSSLPVAMAEFADRVLGQVPDDLKKHRTPQPARKYMVIDRNGDSPKLRDSVVPPPDTIGDFPAYVFRFDVVDGELTIEEMGAADPGWRAVDPDPDEKPDDPAEDGGAADLGGEEG